MIYKHPHIFLFFSTADGFIRIRQLFYKVIDDVKIERKKKTSRVDKDRVKPIKDLILYQLLFSYNRHKIQKNPNKKTFNEANGVDCI